MEDLSRVYFSSAPSPEAADRGEPSPALPSALVTVANAAGAAGENFLYEMRRRLAGRGHRSLPVRGSAEGYRVDGEPGPCVSGAELLDRVRGGIEPVTLFLIDGSETGPDDPVLLRSGDASLLLVNTEPDDLRRAYLRLRAAVRSGGGTVPAVVPVVGGDRWARLAPGRLAEAAARFLGLRIPIWGEGNPEETARLLAARLSGMRERKKQGAEPLVRRLTAVIGGAA